MSDVWNLPLIPELWLKTICPFLAEESVLPLVAWHSTCWDAHHIGQEYAVVLVGETRRAKYEASCARERKMRLAKLEFAGHSRAVMAEKIMALDAILNEARAKHQARVTKETNKEWFESHKWSGFDNTRRRLGPQWQLEPCDIRTTPTTYIAWLPPWALTFRLDEKHAKHAKHVFDRLHVSNASCTDQDAQTIIEALRRGNVVLLARHHQTLTESTVINTLRTFTVSTTLRTGRMSLIEPLLAQAPDTIRDHADKFMEAVVESGQPNVIDLVLGTWYDMPRAEWTRAKSMVAIGVVSPWPEFAALFEPSLPTILVLELYRALALAPHNANAGRDFRAARTENVYDETNYFQKIVKDMPPERLVRILVMLCEAPESRDMFQQVRHPARLPPSFHSGPWSRQSCRPCSCASPRSQSKRPRGGGRNT
jgi:hypothetical protein